MALMLAGGCAKLRRAALTALLMLVAIACVGSAQVEAGPTEIRVWVGKYPFVDAVGGWTFLESPEVSEALVGRSWNISTREFGRNHATLPPADARVPS
jgi:hypothetical protein